MPVTKEQIEKLESFDLEQKTVFGYENMGVMEKASYPEYYAGEWLRREDVLALFEAKE